MQNNNTDRDKIQEPSKQQKTTRKVTLIFFSISSFVQQQQQEKNKKKERKEKAHRIDRNTLGYNLCASVLTYMIYVNEISPGNGGIPHGNCIKKIK